MNVERLLEEIKSIIDETTFNSIKNAFLKAEDAHKKQFRDNRDPYIFHPLRVCLILAKELKIKDKNTLMIALLHDVVEDSDVTIEEIKALFGDKVAEGVDLLTKNIDFKDDITYQNKYFWHLKRAPKKVQLVKLADRLDNLRELVTCGDITKQRKYILDTSYHYLTWAKGINPYIAAEMEDLIFLFNDKSGDYDI